MKKAFYIIFSFTLINNFSFAQLNIRQRIAILPFSESSVGSQYSNFVNGISDMLITKLGGSNKLDIIDSYDFTQESSSRISINSAIDYGKKIRAHKVVSGNFLAYQNEIRLDVRIIDVQSERIFKTINVTGDSDDLFNLVDKLSYKLLILLEKRGRKVIFDKNVFISYSDLRDGREIFRYIDENFKDSKLVVKITSRFTTGNICTVQMKRNGEKYYYYVCGDINLNDHPVWFSGGPNEKGLRYIQDNVRRQRSCGTRVALSTKSSNS